MPYISQNNREYIDVALKVLVDLMPDEDTGITNYVITRIVGDTMCPYLGWSYSSLSKALAVFRDAEAEMRRRLLDPYEDKAIERNGDIPEYESFS